MKRGQGRIVFVFLSGMVDSGLSCCTFLAPLPPIPIAVFTQRYLTPALTLKAPMRKENTRSKEIDAYISAQPLETQRALEELRECIWQAAPNVTELLNYRIPAFALVDGGKRDQQIMISGYRKHVGLYPHPDVIEAFAAQLADYKSAKGSVQFPLDRPIPRALVVDMVKYRLAQLQS